MKRKKTKRQKKEKNFHRSYDVAGVTVMWNSPPPLAVDDVPAVVVVREVDDVDGEENEDVGMNWSPAEFAFIIVELIEVDVRASDDNGDGDGDNDDDDDIGWIESWWWDDEIFILVGELERFPVVEDDGDERRAWYQSRFCSNVSKIELASG